MLIIQTYTPETVSTKRTRTRTGDDLIRFGIETRTKRGGFVSGVYPKTLINTARESDQSPWINTRTVAGRRRPADQQTRTVLVIRVCDT